MIIKFKEIHDYRINIDEFNHTVQALHKVEEKRSPHYGQLKWKNISYHPNIPQACRSIGREIIGFTEGEVEIKEYIELALDLDKKLRMMYTTNPTEGNEQ